MPVHLRRAHGVRAAGATIALASLLALPACLARAFETTPDQDTGFSPGSGAPLTRCEMSDKDGDRYGTDDSCEVKDCDDTNINIHPGASEACNGIDDNCNALIDEGLGTGTCGLGACKRTVDNCAQGRPQACAPGTPVPEVCNGIDDDCDGVIDNGVVGPPCGVGACLRRAECVNGAFETCVAGTPVPETCNRIDDDCDGVVDNGFRANLINGNYTTLKMHQATCDGAAERMGPNCNAAFHRYCASVGCTTSGFGPLENAGDVAAIGCVAAEGAIEVSYAALAAQQADCNGTAQRVGPACNTAIHRFCVSRGYASGFGPVESSQTSVFVTCLRAGGATVVVTAYSALVVQHDGCSGSAAATRYGPACNAAINRFCRARGFTTGFGPVENAGDSATVTCVSP